MKGSRLGDALGWIKQALDEFLAVPILVVVAFVALAVGCYLLDASFWSAGQPVSPHLRWLGQIFGDTQALSSLLGTVVTGLFTVTSITFSLLLLTVQQAGASFTNQVFGQFLRRTGNQLYFGFFVGLSIFALFGLVVTNGQHRPVFAAAITVVLTAISLFLIILLTYTTINQMRPHAIIDAIRQHVLIARTQQEGLLRATRRSSAFPGRSADREVRSEQCGYVASIAVDELAQAVVKSGGQWEVELQIRIGDYVAYGDPLAALRGEGDGDAVADAVAPAVTLKSHRSLDRDPAFGLEQLGTIGWTIISTARSNPYPGLMICRMLRDILARWAAAGPLAEDRSASIVYDDRLETLPLDTLELLIVVASESMQPQSLAAIMRTLATLLPSLSPALQERVNDIARRSLSALGEHVMTLELERALDGLETSLRAAGFGHAADELARGTDRLGKTVGALHSRSTRAQAG